MEVNNNNITEGYMDKFVDILKDDTYLFNLESFIQNSEHISTVFFPHLYRWSFKEINF